MKRKEIFAIFLFLAVFWGFAVSMILLEREREVYRDLLMQRRIADEEMLFESVGEARAALGKEQSEENRLILLRAAVLGRQSLSSLRMEEKEREMLMRYFSDLAIDNHEDAYPLKLVFYTETLYHYLMQRRKNESGEIGWEEIPQYEGKTEERGEESEPIGILNERDARALAEKALGISMSTDRAVMEGENGYLFVRKNAYVLVGISGHVKQLKMEIVVDPNTNPEYENSVITPIEALVKRRLSDCGYADRSMELQVCFLKDGIYYIEIETTQYRIFMEMTQNGGRLISLNGQRKARSL